MEMGMKKNGKKRCYRITPTKTEDTAIKNE